MNLNYKLLALSLALLWACKKDQPINDALGTTQEVPETLPLIEIPLQDLSAFQAKGKNWQIAGNAYSDYLTEHSLEAAAGKGVLINRMTETDKEHLFTEMEHGDLELEIEFMMPKGSNSGIYFQGRYEIQLLDSWGVKQPQVADCGAIYERWEAVKPEGEQGYEGHPPPVNASKAPGLWQKFHIRFSAPRFDKQGNKIKNASFDYVYHNGLLLHENVEVTGPTRAAAFENEQALGPLMIQGDHGPVAFRNLRYKKFGTEQLALNNLTYQVYQGNWDYIPDFDTLEVVKEGQVDSLINLEDLAGQPDHFALRFQGDLEVPVEGDYLFETLIDDGGDLLIDGNLVVHNQGDPGMGSERSMVHLTAGTHPLALTYYEEVWAANLTVYYEGPEIAKQPLASVDLRARSNQRRDQAPLIVTAQEAPEMLRGFVNYGSEKRTHTMAVGDPVGIHYSYDLDEGTLLTFWRGGFADVTEMWQGRGEPQLIKPLNASAERTAGVAFARLENQDETWPINRPDDYKFKGYHLDTAQRPVFEYQNGAITLEDQIQPEADSIKIQRQLLFKSDAAQSNYWHRLAAADYIQQLPNGLYSIGGQYYLDLAPELANEVVIREQGGGTEMIIPVLEDSGQSVIKYSLLW